MDDSAGSGGGTAGSPVQLTIVDTWLTPLAGSPCGESLEYDDDFREMEKAAVGRPPSQFEVEGVQPDWRGVLTRAQSLFERSRDLRVAIYWARARVRLDGASTLLEGLRLVEGLLSRFWDDLHPVPDDGDAYARVNAINDMCSPAGLLSDLRESKVLDDRSIGELRGRDIEVALGQLESRSGDAVYPRQAVEQMLATAGATNPALRSFPTIALAKVAELQQLMRDRVGYAAAPDMQPLVSVLTGLRNVMPGAASPDAGSGETSGASDDAVVGATGGGASRPAVQGALSGAIESRKDALRAIDMICEYLERAEPSNPAQLLLRRASRLINKNFVELVREFAPESLNEVARVMGLSAEELSVLQAQE